jgi:hypothetical protein
MREAPIDIMMTGQRKGNERSRILVLLGDTLRAGTWNIFIGTSALCLEYFLIGQRTRFIGSVQKWHSLNNE